MNRIFIILLILVLGIVILVAGGGAGIIYQAQKPAQSQLPVSDTGKTLSAINQLSSKVISLIMAYGQVADINGRNITLSSGGDSVVIKIPDNAQVLSLIVGSKGNTIRQQADFSKIKKGDKLNINLKLLSDGTLSGQQVMFLPSSK